MIFYINIIISINSSKELFKRDYIFKLIIQYNLTLYAYFINLYIIKILIKNKINKII